MIKKAIKKRQEHEEFEARIQHEDKVRADQKRKNQEHEQTELEKAKSWPAQQNAITLEEQWPCHHYQRRCLVKFECCNVFFSCQYCHNDSKECSNDKTLSSAATHYKCTTCDHEGKIAENSQHCAHCQTTMATYFCSVCKHFTSTFPDPYHCEKCGVCRINKGNAFHCDVCNVCLYKWFENIDKCLPNSNHDTCGVCLEDAFWGCLILPCSHKVHQPCAIAMIQHGIRTCLICRHPLFSTFPDEN